MSKKLTAQNNQNNKSSKQLLVDNDNVYDQKLLIDLYEPHTVFDKMGLIANQRAKKRHSVSLTKK